jgi:hypothetical protein
MPFVGYASCGRSAMQRRRVEHDNVARKHQRAREATETFSFRLACNQDLFFWRDTTIRPEMFRPCTPSVRTISAAGRISEHLHVSGCRGGGETASRAPAGVSRSQKIGLAFRSIKPTQHERASLSLGSSAGIQGIRGSHRLVSASRER